MRVCIVMDVSSAEPADCVKALATDRGAQYSDRLNLPGANARGSPHAGATTMRVRASLRLVFASIFSTAMLAGLITSGGLGGCAGVKQQQGMGTGNTTGFGGSGAGPMVPVPTIEGLEALAVSPKTMAVPLAGGATGQLTGTQQMTATGTIGGVSMDLTQRVKWTSNLPGATVAQTGLVTIVAPGTYTITAQATASAGGAVIKDSAMLTASFSGDIFGDGFNSTNNNKPVLDSSPTGLANLAYPLDHALFPSNLSPIYAHIQANGTGQIARLNFQAGGGTNVNFYANCEQPAGVAPGCYVKMPLSLTRLFIAASESGDIKLTARVLTAGASAPAETASVNVAWANVALSGGLYYWSVIPNPPRKTGTDNIPTPPTYILLDPTQTNGTEILRYAFTADGNSDPTPQVVWTDDGGPSSTPPYNGAPQSVVNGVAGGHCIGCHSISNDGKYMTLTLGGSSTKDGANFSLLDIGQQTLININPAASTDPNSSPTVNPFDYWKKFRMEGLATENTWGPKADRVVSMFGSKLYLTQITVTAGALTGTATRMGAVVPTWQAQEGYASDPFWSQDGTRFVFTSFPAPSIGLYNDTGLNGDMKKGGQIVIATADENGVHDDAKVLISRENGKTSYYPSISNDSQMVVYNQSTCGADPDSNKLTTDYGNQSCDGYDDSTAKLWVVPITGGASTLLGRANGDGNFDNSWPRFSPDKGVFRGQDLYWIAFSSRRPYGLQVNNQVAASATKPQLWIAGVTKGGEFTGPDPSFAPAWLPAQNPNPAAPNGNHVPQWVKVAVIID